MTNDPQAHEYTHATIHAYGIDSIVVGFRYGKTPATSDDRRCCEVHIQPSNRTAPEIIVIRGYSSAVSNLVGGTDVQLMQSTDSQIEYGKYRISVVKEGAVFTLDFAELDPLAEES